MVHPWSEVDDEQGRAGDKEIEKRFDDYPQHVMLVWIKGNNDFIFFDETGSFAPLFLQKCIIIGL